MTKAIIIIATIAWLLSNIIVSKKMSAAQLGKMVYSGNCTVGKAFSSIFYAPAWILKGVRVIVLATIK